MSNAARQIAASSVDTSRHHEDGPTNLRRRRTRWPDVQQGTECSWRQILGVQRDLGVPWGFRVRSWSSVYSSSAFRSLHIEKVYGLRGFTYYGLTRRNRVEVLGALTLLILWLSYIARALSASKSLEVRAELHCFFKRIASSASARLCFFGAHREVHTEEEGWGSGQVWRGSVGRALRGGE